jgi:hypothetical protein
MRMVVRMRRRCSGRSGADGSAGRARADCRASSCWVVVEMGRGEHHARLLEVAVLGRRARRLPCPCHCARFGAAHRTSGRRRGDARSCHGVGRRPRSSLWRGRSAPKPKAAASRSDRSNGAPCGSAWRLFAGLGPTERLRRVRWSSPSRLFLDIRLHHRLAEAFRRRAGEYCAADKLVEHGAHADRGYLLRFPWPIRLCPADRRLQRGQSHRDLRDFPTQRTLGVAGGTAPAVATWLIELTGHPSVPAMYIMAGASISAVAALSVRASSRQAISDSIMPHLAPSAIPGR